MGHESPKKRDICVPTDRKGDIADPEQTGWGWRGDGTHSAFSEARQPDKVSKTLSSFTVARQTQLSAAP